MTSLVLFCSPLSKTTLLSLQTPFFMSYECHKAVPALHPKDAVIVPGLQILLKFSTVATYVAVAMKLDRWGKSSELSKPLKLVIGSKYAGMDIIWPFIYSTRLIAEHVRASWGFQRLFYWQLNACSTLDDFTAMQHTPCFSPATDWVYLVHIWGDSSDLAFSKIKQVHTYQNLSAMQNSVVYHIQCMWLCIDLHI